MRPVPVPQVLISEPTSPPPHCWETAAAVTGEAEVAGPAEPAGAAVGRAWSEHEHAGCRSAPGHMNCC